MINSDPSPAQSTGSQDERADRIVASGPRGTIVLAGISTAIVVAIWFAFYLLVFMPRGAMQ